jgi:hypothetical protein
MRERFGEMPLTRPDGMFRRVHWPSLMKTDAKTGDGRLFPRDGGGTRDLPLTWYAQLTQQEQHNGAVVAGRVDMVEFQDDGNVEAWGWALDDDNGRTAARYVATKTLRHNSVDLADVGDVQLLFDENAGEGENPITFLFPKWNLTATTLLGKPAFGTAHTEMSDLMSLEELTAAYGEDDTIEVDGEVVFTINGSDELTASLAPAPSSTEALTVPWDDFHIAETPYPQKIVVTADGTVYGHLSMWEGGDVPTPRPADGYASFNQAGPLTELGQVETGPIFFEGGHPDKPLGKRDPYAAYGGVENCWADVRVSEGRLGPWISGRVRPGQSEEALYVARASRISGHWVGNELRAIVSVNVPRFNVKGTGLSDTGTRMFLGDSGEVLELVASFDPDRFAGAEMLIEGQAGGMVNLFGLTPGTYKINGNEITVTTELTTTTEIVIETDDEEVDELAVALAEAALAEMAIGD